MDEQNKIKHTTVQTYAEDMAKAIEYGQGEGIVKKIIHSDEETQERKKESSPESIKNKLLTLGGLILIIVSLFTLNSFFSKQTALVVEIPEQFTPLIFTDKSSLVEIKDFSKEKIVETILKELDDITLKNGGVGGIYLTVDKKMIGLREFISSIKGNFVPGSLDFVSDKFLFGFVKTDKNNPFILIKVRSLPEVFEAMRAWETKMFTDIYTIFNTETINPEYFSTKTFKDGIVENKNARILYDDTNPENNSNNSLDKKIILMYIFADDKSVVITNTKDSAREVLRRLAGSQTEK